MEFTLYYRGELKSNGSPVEKQYIRRTLHPQLKHLWDLEPLRAYKDWLSRSERRGRTNVNKLCLLEDIGAFTFAPLISSKIFLCVEINITLLRPEPPGAIIIQSGDIDNRLKTLFDALSMPSHSNQIPPDDLPGENETPMYCLLEDDRLISSIEVRTDRLLEPPANEKEVILFIRAKTRVTRHIMANVHFI